MYGDNACIASSQYIGVWLDMKKRLSKLQWLEHGLEILAETGFGALKAEPLSHSLGVTRGSFYWHFSDISNFHNELLALWKQRACDDVIREIENERNDGDKLRALLSDAMANDQKLERAVRSWAVHAKIAARSVEFVDKVRLEYLIKILGSAPIDDSERKLRAELIYWSWLGRMMVAGERESWSKGKIEKVAALFQS